MTLRLVLVSLVAALGFTIPGTPVIESWVASTQDWINARFADWDTRNLPLTNEIGPKSHKLDCSLARRPSQVSEAVNAPEVPSGALKKTPSIVETLGAPLLQPVKRVPKQVESDALEIGEKPLSDVAFRLDARSSLRRTVTLEGPPAPMSSRVRCDTASALVDVARQWTFSWKTWAWSIARSLASFNLTGQPHPRTEPDSRMRTLVSHLVAEPKTESQGPVIIGGQAKAPRCDASNPGGFGAMEQSESLYFATDLPQASASLVCTPPACKNRMPVMSSSVAFRSIAAPAPAGVGDAYEDMDVCLLPFEGGFSHPIAKPIVEQRAPAAAPAAPSVGWVSKQVVKLAPRHTVKPRFEPAEVGEDQTIGVTFHLNPPVDGDKTAPVPSDVAVAPAPASLPIPTIKAQSLPMRLAPDLIRAVKLTREAVYAWANVLTGPAIITVAEPNSNRVK